jgi:hypothetical protein
MDRERPTLGDAIVFITGELIALPFCFAGADGFMKSDWWTAAKGFAIGLPCAIAGLTFHF